MSVLQGGDGGGVVRSSGTGRSGHAPQLAVDAAAQQFVGFWVGPGLKPVGGLRGGACEGQASAAAGRGMPRCAASCAIELRGAADCCT